MATIFFGGWRGPEFIPGWMWFWLKSWIGVFIFQWAFRSTFPRLRTDQLQAFCWKFLVPAALVNVGVTAVLGKLHLILGQPWMQLMVTYTEVEGRRVAQFGPQDPLQWAMLLGLYLLANAITVAILLIAYRGEVRRSAEQMDAKVDGGLSTQQGATVAEREAVTA